VPEQEVADLETPVLRKKLMKTMQMWRKPNGRLGHGIDVSRNP